MSKQERAEYKDLIKADNFLRGFPNLTFAQAWQAREQLSEQVREYSDKQTGEAKTWQIQTYTSGSKRTLKDNQTIAKSMTQREQGRLFGMAYQMVKCPLDIQKLIINEIFGGHLSNERITEIMDMSIGKIFEWASLLHVRLKGGDRVLVCDWKNKLYIDKNDFLILSFKQLMRVNLILEKIRDSVVNGDDVVLQVYDKEYATNFVNDVRLLRCANDRLMIDATKYMKRFHFSIHYKEPFSMAKISNDMWWGCTRVFPCVAVPLFLAWLSRTMLLSCVQIINEEAIKKNIDRKNLNILIDLSGDENLVQFKQTIDENLVQFKQTILPEWCEIDLGLIFY